MDHVMSALRNRLEKRAAYLKTVQEIKQMPLDVALDLDIHRADAKHLAHKAVYEHQDTPVTARG